MSSEVLMMDLSLHNASKEIFGIIAALLKKCDKNCKYMELLQKSLAWRHSERESILLTGCHISREEGRGGGGISRYGNLRQKAISPLSSVRQSRI